MSDRTPDARIIGITFGNRVSCSTFVHTKGF
jgi:hypothetical protein